jgi:DNA-binding CsgD family transcriptional regulator
MDIFKVLDSFISDMDSAESVEDVFDLLRKQVERTGFTMYTYILMVSPDEKSPANPLWVSSYPLNWTEHYLENHMGPDDLVVRHSAISGVPFSWADLKKRYVFTKAQKLVFSEGREVGIKCGATVPIHGPGKAVATFSVANDNDDEEFQKLFKEKRHELHIMATYAHEKLIQLGIGKETAYDVKLTAREIEILTWTARGKTRWEISEILSLSEETVKTHLTHAAQKLGVSNKAHAVSIALNYGIIQL